MKINGIQPGLEITWQPVALNPTSFYIEVTKNCNEKCSMCPRTYQWPDRYHPRYGSNGRTSNTRGRQRVVWTVNLADDGPSGGFFWDGNPLPW